MPPCNSHNVRPRVSRRVESEPKGTETVLLVDRTPVQRGALSRLLRQLGYQVIKATSAVDAQKSAANGGNIQLLLVDHSSVERTADLELALWFRAKYPEMKILVAWPSLWDLNYSIGELPGINLLAKPFTAHELARMLRKVLED